MDYELRRAWGRIRSKHGHQLLSDKVCQNFVVGLILYPLIGCSASPRERTYIKILSLEFYNLRNKFVFWIDLKFAQLYNPRNTIDWE